MHQTAAGRAEFFQLSLEGAQLLTAAIVLMPSAAVFDVRKRAISRPVYVTNRAATAARARFAGCIAVSFMYTECALPA